MYCLAEASAQPLVDLLTGAGLTVELTAGPPVDLAGPYVVADGQDVPYLHISGKIAKPKTGFADTAEIQVNAGPLAQWWVRCDPANALR